MASITSLERILWILVLSDYCRGFCAFFFKYYSSYFSSKSEKPGDQKARQISQDVVIQCLTVIVDMCLSGKDQRPNNWLAPLSPFFRTQKMMTKKGAPLPKDTFDS